MHCKLYAQESGINMRVKSISMFYYQETKEVFVTPLPFVFLFLKCAVLIIQMQEMGYLIWCHLGVLSPQMYLV